MLPRSFFQLKIFHEQSASPAKCHHWDFENAMKTSLTGFKRNIELVTPAELSYIIREKLSAAGAPRVEVGTVSDTKKQLAKQRFTQKAQAPASYGCEMNSRFQSRVDLPEGPCQPPARAWVRTRSILSAFTLALAADMALRVGPTRDWKREFI